MVINGSLLTSLFFIILDLIVMNHAIILPLGSSCWITQASWGSSHLRILVSGGGRGSSTMRGMLGTLIHSTSGTVGLHRLGLVSYSGVQWARWARWARLAR